MDLQSATHLVLAILQQHQSSIGTESQSPAYQANIGSQAGNVGVHDRWIVSLNEITAGVIRVTMRDIEVQRGQQLASEVHSEAELSAVIETWYAKIAWWGSRLTVYRLQPDQRYRVKQSFKDYYGGVFEAGTFLTYVEQHFLPYDGGYTIVFQEANLYLQEEINADLLDNFDLYIEEI